MKYSPPLPPCLVDKWPLVTLITPTYNQADYLAATIDSVLAQDYPHIEYIVLDDGSTDTTPDILDRYDGRLRWSRHENMGQSATLNKGWRASRGEILGYISSDDRLKPNAVLESVKVFLANPKVIVTYPDFSLIDAKGKTIRNVQAEVYSPHRLVEDLVCIPGPGVFFRRSAFDAVNGWNQQLLQIPDFDFWLRLTHLGEFRHIEQILADYRIHEDSASYRAVSAKRADEIVAVVDKYWSSSAHDVPLDANLSRSMSNILSARLHFISGRYPTGLRRLVEAFRLSPKRFTEVIVWRIIAAGLLRKLYYSVRRILAK